MENETITKKVAANEVIQQTKIIFTACLIGIIGTFISIGGFLTFGKWLGGAAAAITTGLLAFIATKAKEKNNILTQKYFKQETTQPKQQIGGLFK